MDRWQSDFCQTADEFSQLSLLSIPFHRFDNWPQLEDFNAWLKKHQVNNLKKSPIKAIAQAKPPYKGTLALSYEEKIWHRGEVSTRLQSWHDFFNILMWMSFPRSKASLNEQQVTETQSDKSRTPKQQILTRFDEGGSVLCIDAQDLEEWSGILKAYHPLHQPLPSTLPNFRKLIFGHALFESMIKKNFAINTTTVLVTFDEDPYDLLPDALLKMSDEKISAMMNTQDFSVGHYIFGFPLRID